MLYKNCKFLYIIFMICHIEVFILSHFIACRSIIKWLFLQQYGYRNIYLRGYTLFLILAVNSYRRVIEGSRLIARRKVVKR